jgi:hypothetical protein
MPSVLVKDRLWPHLGYRPHAGQVRVHASSSRHRVNAAGRRFGKSFIGGHELTTCSLEARLRRQLLEDLGIRQEYWIVGPNYTDAEKEFRVLFNDLKRLKVPFDRPGTYNDPKGGTMQISLWDGKFLVQAKSAAHPESLVGEGLHGVVMAEAAKMKGSVWSKYIRPTLADFQGWSLWNSTPEGKNHFYEMWELGQDPKMTEWESFRSPSWLNNFVFRQGATPEQLAILKDPTQGSGLAIAAGLDPEVAAMWNELGAVMFGQEVECSFSEYAGLVYGDFDEEVHVRHIPYDPALPLYVATDYGFTNPNVALFIQVDVWDNVYVIGEYYERLRTEEEFASDVLNDPKLGAMARIATKLYPDPEDPGATRVLQNRWKVQSIGGTGGLLKDRINLIRKHLKVQNQHLPFGHVDRQPKLFVDRSCRMIRDEMGKYRYPENKSEIRDNPEKPVKKDDHALEALSRFFGGYYGSTGKGRTRIRTASLSG